MKTRKFTGDMASQVERDRDELVALRSKCERLERELAASNTVMDAIQKEEDGLRAKCERLEVQSAQMREALEQIESDYALRPYDAQLITKALSTTAGTAILARLEEARRLLGRDDWHHNQSSWDEFQSRRDAWLNGGI